MFDVAGSAYGALRPGFEKGLLHTRHGICAPGFSNNEIIFQDSSTLRPASLVFDVVGSAYGALRPGFEEALLHSTHGIRAPRFSND